MPQPPRIPDQLMDAKTFKDIEHFEIGSFKAKLRMDRDQIIKLQSSKVKKGKKIIEKNKHHYTNKYQVSLIVFILRNYGCSLSR